MGLRGLGLGDIRRWFKPDEGWARSQEVADSLLRSPSQTMREDSGERLVP